MRSPGLAALALLAVLVLPARGDEEGIRDADLAMALRFLRAEELGGRRPGEPGFEATARFLAEELRHLGLVGGGRGGSYFLPFEVVLGAPSSECVVAIRSGEDSHALAPGRDFVPLPFSREGEVEGSAVFAGYAGVSPEEDLAGKIALVVRKDPDTVLANAAAAATGAVAVLVVDDPRRRTLDRVFFADGRIEDGVVEDQGMEFLFVPSGSETPRLLTKEAVKEIRFAVPPGPIGTMKATTLPEKQGPVVAASLSAEAAERLLGRSLVEVLDALDRDAGKGRFEVEGVSVRVKVAFRREKRGRRNVAARLVGSDPKKRRETVVVGARYDAGPEDDVGAAAGLAAAAALAAGKAPARSVLVVFWVGGDSGELGPSRLAASRELTPARTVAWIALSARGEISGLTARGGEQVEMFREMLVAAAAGLPPVATGEEAPLEGLLPAYGNGHCCLALRSAGSESGALDLARLASRVARAVASAPERPVRGDLPPPKPAKPRPPRPGPRTSPPKAKPEAVPEQVEPVLSAIRAARFAGRLEGAEAAVGSALEKEPGRVELYLERGRIRIRAKNREGALEDAANLTKLDPSSGWGDLLRSELHFSSGETAKGRRALDRAAAFDRPEALLARALRKLDAERPNADTVRADLRAAGEKGPDTAAGHCAKGLLLLMEGRGAGRAIDELDLAIEKDPFLAVAFRYRAEARTGLDREPATVQTDCNRAIELGLSDPSLWFNRGLARLKLRLFTLSIRDFKAHVEKVPDAASAVYNIACAQALMGNKEEALSWLSRAMDAGFSPVDHARTDPDLESIRSDPRFERILRSAHSE